MSEVILDLSAYAEETADIRLADGNVLHLRKPTEALVIELLQLRDVNAESDPETLVQALNRVCMAILNNNTEGRTYAPVAVSGLPMAQRLAIVQAYSDFAARLMANPTASSPSSQGRKKKKGR